MPATDKPSWLLKAEHTVELLLFGGRWLLAPMYLGLVASLLALVLKFGVEVYHLALHIFDEDFQQISLRVLGLLDITLLGNLIVIMIFAGYENFVSKIAVAKGSVDRPSWMGKVDYSDLKIKLIGSLVAISVIELLKDFMKSPENEDFEATQWRIAIHLTFVVSGVLFAVMDYIANMRSGMKRVEELESKLREASK
jgi:uncharacterized protein (TIGR00645 family)